MASFGIFWRRRRVSLRQLFRQFLAGLEARIPFCGDGDGLPGGGLPPSPFFPLSPQKLPTRERFPLFLAARSPPIHHRKGLPAISALVFFISVLAGPLQIIFFFCLFLSFGVFRWRLL